MLRSEPKVLCKGERFETDRYLRFNMRMHKVSVHLLVYFWREFPVGHREVKRKISNLRIMRNKGCGFCKEQTVKILVLGSAKLVLQQESRFDGVSS